MVKAHLGNAMTGMNSENAMNSNNSVIIVLVKCVKKRKGVVKCVRKNSETYLRLRNLI